MPEDPSLLIDVEGIKQSADDIGEYANQLEKQREARAATEEADQKIESEALAEQDDPRNAERWGLKALAKEGQSIF